MTRSRADPGRRRFIRVVAVAAVAVPVGNAAFCGAAHAAELISETDPAAMTLKYKADATKAPERKDAMSFCDNCNYYTGKESAANGACAALSNRLVAAKGWCLSWEGY